MRFQKKGKAKFGKTTQPRINEFEVKFLKQLELSQNDANVIESLQKKICAQKVRIEELLGNQMSPQSEIEEPPKDETDKL